MKRIATLALLAVLLSPEASRAQSCVPVPPNIVSWWSGEGNAQDNWNGNHGILQNGIGFGAGEVGLAFLLDGSDDYVAVPHNAGLDITGDITIDAWVKPAAYSGQQVIVSKRSFDNQDANIIYFMETNGRLTFSSRSGGGSFNSVTSVNAVALGRWTLVALTIRGSTLTFYFDGLPEAAQSFAFPRPSNTGRLTIGILEIDPNLIPPNGLAAPWIGSLDEVEIFSRALTDSEVALIYNAGPAGKCPPFVPAKTTTWGAVKEAYR